AFLVVEPAVAIFVELFYQFSFLAHTPESSRPLASLTGTERRRPLEPGRSLRWWKCVLRRSFGLPLTRAGGLSRQGRGKTDQTHQDEGGSGIHLSFHGATL